MKSYLKYPSSPQLLSSKKILWNVEVSERGDESDYCEESLIR